MASHGGQAGAPTIRDDSPELRSVALLRKESTVVLPSAPASLKRSPVGNSTALAKQQGGLGANWGLRKEWSATTTSSWVVKAEDLEPLPVGFQLERTHCTIEEDAMVVSERISETLRILSIDSTFCSKSAKVSCQTDDCVRFKIHMFAGENDGQPVIVEVQKSCGPGFLFARTCRMLLNAVQGKAATPAGSTLKPMSLPPLCNMKCLEGARKELTQTEAHEHLRSVVRMLSSERLDERWLAIENLCCLTDSTKTSASVSNVVSEAFLKDETLRSAVLLMLSPASEGCIINNRVSYHQAKQHLPFMAFANAVTQLRLNGSLLTELIASDAWFTRDFVPQLLHQIGFDGQLCVSYHGTRCLLALLICCGTVHDSEITKAVISNGGKEILTKVHERSVHHQRLEHETNMCLDFLRGD